MVLSGPSCVGKGPLIAALNTFHDDLVYETIPIIKSRESRPSGPRPDELDLWDDPAYFRDSAEILSLRSNKQYVVGDCRGLPQALDLDRITSSNLGLLFLEVHHILGSQLANLVPDRDIAVETVFLSPLGIQEIHDLQQAGINVSDYLSDIMLHKQLIRARFQGKLIDDTFITDALDRAKEAAIELRSATHYRYVIVNHDGEGCSNWNRDPTGEFTVSPEGDAGRALDSMVGIFRAGDGKSVERWSTSPL
jgi:guanylate kinase